jgi:hypothetical protein
VTVLLGQRLGVCIVAITADSRQTSSGEAIKACIDKQFGGFRSAWADELLNEQAALSRHRFVPPRFATL